MGVISKGGIRGGGGGGGRGGGKKRPGRACQHCDFVIFAPLKVKLKDLNVGT